MKTRHRYYDAALGAQAPHLLHRVSSASYLVVEDMHTQVVVVVVVLVVSSSSDSSNASTEVRADVPAIVAGDMHAWNSVDITRPHAKPIVQCQCFVKALRDVSSADTIVVPIVHTLGEGIDLPSGKHGSV